MKLMLTYSRRLWLLWLLLILGLCLTGAFQLLIHRIDPPLTAQLRIISIIQQLLMFMLPASICALLSTRLPADLLGVRRLPSWKMLLVALLTLLASIPVMNALVQICELLPWPPQVLAEEAENQRTINLMIGNSGVANTLLALCVVAVLPALCEELFFRGALQNLLRSKPMSAHLAVWLAAICFSLLHAQPVGFIPRILLGAGFGYVAFWSGSLWTAIACHMLNNALVVITQQAGMNPDALGLSTPALSVASAIMTAAGLYIIWRNYSRSMPSSM